jgi:hypothetical protein
MAVVSVGSLWSLQASAEPVRVALVRPEASLPSARKALNLIQGELTGDGFDVVLVESPEEVQSPPAGSPDGRALASIEVTVDEDGRGAELRVVDRLTSKTVTRRTSVDSVETDQVAHVLAVRAVELLRASLVELLMQEPAKPAPLVQKDQANRASRWVARSLDQDRRSTWGFDAGAAGLIGFGGVQPALLSLLRVRAAVHRSLQLRATFAGLGTQPLVSSALGSARLSEDLGLIEGVFVLWPASVVHPIVSLGAGAMYVSADGQAALPYDKGVENSAWGFVVDAGTGVTLRLGRSFDLDIEVHAFLTQPSFVTQFVDQTGPGLSQPSLLGTLSVVGWP